MHRVTAREFSEWCAYDRIDPYGRERLDIAAGIIASATVNCHIPRGKKTTRPIDFMPDWDGSRAAKKVQSEDLMKANFQAAMKEFAKFKKAKNGTN